MIQHAMVCMRNLHDPKHIRYGESWYYSMLKSPRLSNMNSTGRLCASEGVHACFAFARARTSLELRKNIWLLQLGGYIGIMEKKMETTIMGYIRVI